ncbi:hypothetical protein CQW23_16561 [Capsicum baccatum]|uniref:Uncharacterized protein n=1 Tax=Capsicum baccatum TaxID=33114 RepID=A0A2G2WBA1_CAPBA|nr:hypothetical protein CQW23_16561 [Capsicum baccatum]
MSLLLVVQPLIEATSADCDRTWTWIKALTRSRRRCATGLTLFLPAWGVAMDAKMKAPQRQLGGTRDSWIEVRYPPPFRSGRSTALELEATIRSDWIWSYPTQPRNLERSACLDGRDIDNYPKEAYYSADRSGEPAMITKLTKAAAYANWNHSLQSEQQCEEEMNSILFELDLDGDIITILHGGGVHVTHDGRLTILSRDCGLHVVK